MIAYFIRRLALGFFTLMLSTFIIFSMGIYLGSQRFDMYRFCCQVCTGRPCDPAYTDYLQRAYKLDKPWPSNYFSWLFDPEGVLTSFYYDQNGHPAEHRRIDLNVSLGILQIKGSGLLTGNLGTSHVIEPGESTVQLLASVVKMMFAPIISLIIVLTIIVTAQRWRRPQPYRVSALPTASALVDWWHLHSRSPLDVAIIKRQWG